ncbi:MAG: glycosyltransferase family 4 protein [Pseudomonadales bacterium]
MNNDVLRLKDIDNTDAAVDQDPGDQAASAGKDETRSVLIIVENLPCPFDRRVWQEATTLQRLGYEVTIICPTGKDFERRYEFLDGVHIHRYGLPLEADGAVGYALEYGWAAVMQFILAVRVFLKRRFHVIHACNPPDTIFLVALPFRLFGVKLLFDHHDINPELYLAKFGRKDFFYRLLLWLERTTFAHARVSIATNESYRRIAIERGRMPEDRVFVVRSGPKLDRLKIIPPVPERKRGRPYLVGYVGVMGRQEGIDLLLESIRYLVHDRGRTDIQFTLVGSGTELEWLQQLAVRYEVDAFVEFTGRVSDEVLLEVLNSADICVNPDRVNDMNDKSTMNKIMEYMALEKPIVQFELAEGRFSAGESSLYARCNDPIDFAHQIERLLAEPAMRERMGRIGRQRVLESLSWEHQVPALKAAYDCVFEERKGRS